MEAVQLPLPEVLTRTNKKGEKEYAYMAPTRPFGILRIKSSQQRKLLI